MTRSSRDRLRQWCQSAVPGLFLWWFISLGFQVAGVSRLTSHLLAIVVTFAVLWVIQFVGKPSRRER